MTWINPRTAPRHYRDSDIRKKAGADMIQHILTAVDGSSPSKKSLEFACELALKFNAEISIVHVVDYHLGEQSFVLGSSHVTMPLHRDEMLKSGESVVNAAVEIARKKGCVIAQSDVLSGPAAHQIVDYADKHSVDTIVIGSRGLGNVAGLLLGSVSHKVSHLAKCTCITVH
jgi:nucleotide-binding universal stress UspA family protein